MDLLLAVIALVAISSLVGASTYLLCREMRPSGLHCFISLFLYWMLFSVFQLVPNLDGWFLLLCLVVSLLGTWAHRRSSQSMEESFKAQFRLVFTATVLSVFWGTLLMFLIGELFLPTQFGRIIFFGNLVLLALSPSLMPFLLWIAQSAKPRPGLDTHLED